MRGRDQPAPRDKALVPWCARTWFLLLVVRSHHPDVACCFGWVLVLPPERDGSWVRIFIWHVQIGTSTDGGLIFRTIRLPGGDAGARYVNQSGPMATLASVPWFMLGVTGIAYEWVAERLSGLTSGLSPRRGYRTVPVDEDARILRFEDEE